MEQSVQHLAEMGFDRNVVKSVLKLARFDNAKAMDILLYVSYLPLHHERILKSDDMGQWRRLSDIWHRLI
jgi:hypothetical protein